MSPAPSAVEPDPVAAAERVRAWLDDRKPSLAVIMGSGLGGLSERFAEPRRLPCGEIPGWPESGVEGHAGELVAGRLAGVEVLGLSGRVHLYEGLPPTAVVAPVRILGRLGIRRLFVSNAAGAVNPSFAPGELMLIRDHVNLTWRSPLAGPVREGEARYPDMKGCYDPELSAAVRRKAGELGVTLREGVYAGMLGPSYETPAEIRMLRRIGADAVGMSTVPEVTVARARGIRSVGVSCLSNYAAGVTAEPLSHDEVLETTARVAGTFQELVVRAVGEFEASALLDRSP